jgi:glycosyltransferase involved in cell wall biosynthesis
MVSCILATRNRREFLTQALRCYRRQTYKDSELIVVDDSDRPMRDLCEGRPRMRYIRLTRVTPLGKKLNLGIEAARGDVLCKLDDDDYYGPDYLARSLQHLPKRDLHRTIVTRCCFLILMSGDPEVRHSGHGWQPGGTFCFHRSLWMRHPFRELPRSVDSWLLRDARPRIIRVCDAGQYLVVRHGRNTWNAMTNGETADEFLSGCEPFVTPLRHLMPAVDRRFYRTMLRWE